jgi:adenylosuccinate synthase
MLQRQGYATAVIDGQWGSTGKGKLIGWLSAQTQFAVSVGDNMPNAGHTFVNPAGKKIVLKCLPVAMVNGVHGLIGPHAAFDPDRLLEELEMMRDFVGLNPKLTIHPLASIVTQEDRDAEADLVGSIASTGQGSAEAVWKKTRRSEFDEGHVAQDCSDVAHLLGDTHEIAQDAIGNGAAVLIEGSQGFDLGLNHGTSYPHVTSRDCLLGRMLDNAGLPPSTLAISMVSLRTFPIRVGNVGEASSGPIYRDQQELSWDAVADISGIKGLTETTTVTKRTRRVFTFSQLQLDRMLKFVRPTHAFLNFVNYLGDKRESFVAGIKHRLESQGCRLALLGTGEAFDDMESLI